MSRNQPINLFVVDSPSPRLWLPSPVNKSLQLSLETPQLKVRLAPILLQVKR